jgi:MFS transporter, DHA1 family, multidrug resistance protein
LPLGNRLSIGEKRSSAGWVTGFLPVYLIVFSAFLDTHAQMPILAPYARSLGATPFWVGLAVGAYSFFNIAGNFLVGPAIDRGGWRKPLLLGLAGASLALLVYAFAPNAAFLTLVRSGHGLAGGFLVPAALSSLSSRRRSGEGEATAAPRMAFFGVTVGLAALSGPPLAGLIASRWGYPAVYLALSGVMLTALLAALAVRPVSEAPSMQPAPRAGDYRVLLRAPLLLAASVFALGVMGATGVLAAFLPGRAEALGFGPMQTGLLFAAFALSAIVIQGLWPFFILPRLVKPVRGAISGLPLLGLALLLIPFSKSAAALFAVITLYGAGFGLAFQGMLGLVTGIPGPSWRGKAAGFFFAFYSLGVALVPPAAGLIWELIPALNPFYTGAAAVLLSLTLGWHIGVRS